MHLNRDDIAISRSEIAHLQATYADIVNGRAWSELAVIMHPAVTVEIDTVVRPTVSLVGPAAVGEFIETALERFAFLEFVILNSRIEVAAHDEAAARLYMCEVRRAAETLEWSTAYGVYEDDYRRIDGDWMITRRRYRSLTRTGDGVFAFVPGPLSGEGLSGEGLSCEGLSGEGLSDH